MGAFPWTLPGPALQALARRKKVGSAFYMLFWWFLFVCFVVVVFLRGWKCLGFKSKLFSHEDTTRSFWMAIEVDSVKILALLEELNLWLHSRTKSSILLYKAAFYCVRNAGKALEEFPEPWAGSHPERKTCCGSSPWQLGVMTQAATLDYSCLATSVQYINTHLVARVLQKTMMNCLQILIHQTSQ